MRGILIVGLAFSGINALADDMMETRPATCVTSESQTLSESSSKTSSTKKKKKKGKVVKTTKTSSSSSSSVVSDRIPCTDFNMDYPGPVKGVCIFKSGTWQWGDLKYNKGTGAHTFISKTPCDLGIYVTPQQTTMEVLSPALADYFEGKTDVVDYANKIYASKLAATPLVAGQIPALCYTKDKAGVSSKPQSCAAQPNEPGYCEFTDSPSTKKYSGKWWVRYDQANMKKPSVCEGGLSVTNSALAAASFGTTQNLTNVTKESAATFVAALPKPNIAAMPALGVEMSACVYPTTKNGITSNTRGPCANQSTAGYENWVNDPDLYRANERATIAATYTSQLSTLQKAKNSLVKNNTGGVNDAAIAAKQAEIDALNGTIDDAVDLKLTGMTIFPIDHTVKTRDYCYIEWNPLNATAALQPYTLIAGKNSALTKAYCSKVEKVIESTVTAGP